MPNILSRTSSANSAYSVGSSSTKKLLHFMKRTVSPTHSKTTSISTLTTDKHHHTTTAAVPKLTALFKIDSRTNSNTSTISSLSSPVNSSSSSIPRSASSNNGSVGSAVVPKSRQLTLPEYWEMRFDPVLTQVYYINTKDNSVQFDNPLEVVRL